MLVRPPKILLDAKVVNPGVMWEVTKALYGLRASPADWGAHRDDTLRRWKVDIGGGKELVLRLWKVRLGGSTVGFICCYVDDMMIVGETNIVEAMAQHIKKEWEATDLERVNDKPVKFCGVEVMRDPSRGGSLLVGQEDYIKDVLNRYDGEVPVPKEIEKDGEDTVAHDHTLLGTASIRPKACVRIIDLHRVHAPLVQELPVLSMPLSSAPELQLPPHRLLEVAQQVDPHLKGSLRLTRYHTIADVRPCPSRPQQLLRQSCSSPIHWTSTRQPFVARSTAQAQLLAAMEGVLQERRGRRSSPIWRTRKWRRCGIRLGSMWKVETNWKH